jgi:hypothetical protein
MSQWHGGAGHIGLQEEDQRRRLDGGEGEQEVVRWHRLDGEQPVRANGMEEVKLEDGWAVLAGGGEGQFLMGRGGGRLHMVGRHVVLFHQRRSSETMGARGRGRPMHVD